jgi:CRISPR/Cas system CMR subunit Cmr6 (Cas7 group RAMP superfamily)
MYPITHIQLQAACRIFVEHAYFKSQNELLLEQISLHERSGRAKDRIIQSRKEQVETMNEILSRKDRMIENHLEAIDHLEKQVKYEQRNHKKYLFLGCGVGAAVVSVLVVVLK